MTWFIPFQVHKYVDYILSHQASDGWLGPDDIPDGNCYWSKYPMLLALRQVSSCIGHLICVKPVKSTLPFVYSIMK